MSIGLLKILKRNTLISEDKYEQILNEYQLEAENLVGEAHSVLPYLFDYEVINPKDLAEFLSDIYGYPIFDLSEYDTKFFVSGLVSEDVLFDYKVLPIFKRGNRLFLAVSDPTMQHSYQKLFFNSGFELDYIIVEDDVLVSTFKVIQRESTSIIDELQKDEFFNPIRMMNDDGTSEDGPVAKFVNKIIYDAINSGASDIHFEFYEFYARIRFRMDGVLKEVVQPPLVTKDKLASRIKIMCQMDISEKRIPQDGSMKLKINRKKTIDFRVSTLPTLFGEKIVIRILDNSTGFISLDKLGMNDKEEGMLLEAIYKPYGMILVTGPTGSGKTTTLYNCLNLLNKPEVNICTVEDPVEINLPGANQVSMNEKQGLSFATALRSFLRQDPDIIMLGEIRDLETADIALKSSQTGHLVFSTLHTNTAPGTLTRMVNMGVEPFNIASSVLLVLAQRLVRKLCSNCKKPIKKLPEELLYKLGFDAEDLKGSWRIYGPVGCKFCKGTGFKGRIGIFEVMPITDTIQRAILRGANEKDISDIALSEGMRTLRSAGLEKVKLGVTSIEEVTTITS